MVNSANLAYFCRITKVGEVTNVGYGIPQMPDDTPLVESESKMTTKKRKRKEAEVTDPGTPKKKTRGMSMILLQNIYLSSSP